MIRKTFLMLMTLSLTNLSYAQESLESLLTKQKLIHLLTQWHQHAADANFEAYFNLMSQDAIFIGTDPTEKWSKSEFKTYCKPHFKKKKTWNFVALQRTIYLDETASIAWFDELLDTQMKLCRGSGILKKINGEWKILHYVLSMTIPNEQTKNVIQLKTGFEDSLKQTLIK